MDSAKKQSDIVADFTDIVLQRVLKKGDGGKGYRKCIECGEYSGVRTAICPCGHVFVKGENRKPTAMELMAKDTESEVSDEMKLYAMSIGSKGGRFIYVPAGACPAVLNEIDQPSIFQFCNDIVYEGLAENKIYTTTAIKHWLQHKFGYNSEEYKTVCEFVNLWYDDMIGVDSHENY
jgi:hypothetical protein